MSFLFGSQKSTTSVPDWVKTPILNNIQRATDVANLGYVAYNGPDVAAFTPMQNAAFQNTNDAMSAFGMAAPSNPVGIPQPQTFAGGVQGYSSAGLYQQALDVLRQKNPQQYAALMGLMPNAGLRPPNGGGSGGVSRPTTPTAPAATGWQTYEVTDNGWVRQFDPATGKNRTVAEGTPGVSSTPSMSVLDVLRAATRR